ncbi:MAG: hypothetical protein NTV23_12115 [Propionibacteriales bacterium]|nr:hypothetical protein [Propionibacteriales bacterium]
MPIINNNKAGLKDYRRDHKALTCTVIFIKIKLTDGPLMWEKEACEQWRTSG